MKITLKWNNRAPTAESINVYRSATPMAEGSMPAPIATIAPNAATYDDTTVLFGVQYYYRIGSVKAGVVKLSPEILATAYARSGPGPQTLVDGDLENGLYGILAPGEFISTNPLLAALGISGAAVLAADPSWFKFAYKGKTLFVAASPLARNVAWATLYAAGCVHGTDDFGTGLPSTPLPPVNQRRIITINGEKFIVRLLKGAPTPVAVWGAALANDPAGLDGSEWNDLIYRVQAAGMTAPHSEPYPRFTGVTLPNVETLMDNAYSLTMCQETTTVANSYLVRGARHTTAGVSIVAYAAAISDPSVNGSINISSSTAYPVWRPVLELVP